MESDDKVKKAVYQCGAGDRRMVSSRSNDWLKAKRFGSDLKDMSPTIFAVWFGMQRFMRKWNIVSARYRQIAEFCKMSVGSVHRAMAYMEKNDLIVRTSDPDKNASWMINPLLQWNWIAAQQPKGVAVYRKYVREAATRKQRTTKVDAQIAIPDTDEELDAMMQAYAEMEDRELDEDSLFLGGDWTQETDSCESKSKAA
jgi:hypothetical protein